jgi:hypothetical protein
MGAVIVPAQAAAAGPVSAVPASGTPRLPGTGPVEQVRQLARCDGTMYAVGSFTTVMRNSTRYTRDNVFSFSAAAPFTVISWNPDVNGVVNSTAFNGSGCSRAYIGGAFTAVGGTAAHDIAEIDTSTGAVITSFAHNANGAVETLLGTRGRILAGGDYTSINGSSANPYMTGLNPATDKDDGYVRLHISGSYQVPGAPRQPPSRPMTRPSTSRRPGSTR